MVVETRENDLSSTDVKSEQTQDQTNPLHVLQQAIAAMPAVDPAKVQAVIDKLSAGAIEILGTEEERLRSAQRIAAQILAETTPEK